MKCPGCQTELKIMTDPTNGTRRYLCVPCGIVWIIIPDMIMADAPDSSFDRLKLRKGTDKERQ